MGPFTSAAAGQRGRRTAGHEVNVRLGMSVPSHACKGGGQIRTSVDKEVDLEGSKAATGNSRKQVAMREELCSQAET